MNRNELISSIRSKNYGLPYFKKLASNGVFFTNNIRLDITKKYSDTYLFNQSIKDVFGITDSLFDRCYDQVVNGEGHEDGKINSLRSSSLLGLLVFYPIRLGKRLDLVTEINGKQVSFSFNQVVFEKPNQVFHPKTGLSSIDVALYGTANGEDCVLFLESKFTEYLQRKNMVKGYKKGVLTYPISWKYAQYYKQIMIDFPGINVSYTEAKGIELFGNGSHYCEGIKQMISHYIGATHSDELIKEGKKVYLGTILYDFTMTGTVDDGTIIGDYKQCYQELAKRLNVLTDSAHCRNLIVVEDAFTYQSFLKQAKGFALEQSVKEFYSL